ncbi:MAG TPA: hypothetical protein VGL05_30175 [Kribbella sp.]
MTAVAEALPLDLVDVAREQLLAGFAAVPASKPLRRLEPSSRKVQARAGKRAMRRRLSRIQDPEQRDRALARLELVRYLPRVDGALSEFVTSQGHWIKRVVKAIESSGLRADARRNLYEVAWQVMLRAGWIDHTARVCWDTAAAAAGVSRRALANWLRWLRDNGFLGHVERGTTPRWRKQWQNTLYGEQNRQPVYLLCAPVVGPLRPQEPLPDLHSPGLAVDAQNDAQQLSTGTTCTPTFPNQPSLEKPLRARADSSPWSPQTKQERQQAAEQIRRAGGTSWHTTTIGGQQHDVLVRSPLRAISARHLAHIARDFWEHGWTVDDVQYAIDHRPDGTRHTATSAVLDPARWLRYRLNHWRDADGSPVASHRQRRLAATVQRNAEQDARHAAAAARNAAHVPLARSRAREAFRAVKQAIVLRKHGA